MPDMSVSIAGVTFQNPVMTASGTFGSGMEYSDFVDLNLLGAVVTKGVSSVPWEGNPTPRVAEVYGGMLNAIGLQNPGVDVFIERDLAFLEKTLACSSNPSAAGSDGEKKAEEILEARPDGTECGTKVIVNVCGHTVDEYLDVVKRLGEESRVDMLEINVSCPNVKQGAIAFGTNADSLFNITSRIKKIAKQPVIMKLTPNVTSVAEMAKAAEAGGADAVSLINTITGMKIDVERQKFVLANKTGGMSGPAIHPVAVRMVYEASHAVKIPVIGMGGIQTAEDALEMMLAGATAVAVGAANFHDPQATVKVIDGMQDYAARHHLGAIREIIGAVR